MIPDRVDGAADGRDVVGVGEHRVALLGDAHAAEVARQVGEIGDFDAGDVVEIAGVVAVAADAIGDLPDPAGKVVDVLMKAMPQGGNAGAVLEADALAEAGDQHRLAGLETRRRDGIECGGVHEDRLLKLEVVETRRGADRFGRDAEMVAERAGECFVRAVIRIQRDLEDVGRAARERARRLGEAAGAHIAHHRKPGRGGERPHHVEARDAGDGRDLVERQRLGEMAFDEPERLLGGIHGSRLSFEARPSCTLCGARA